MGNLHEDMNEESICLETWISDTSDPTDLETQKTIYVVPFNHLDHDPLGLE